MIIGRYYFYNLAFLARKVACMLRRGSVGAIPTDTSYGVAADATNPSAVEKVFRVKRRPMSKPLSIFVPSKEFIRETFVVDETVEKALELLPGRFTFILKLKRKRGLAKGVVTSDGSVGVRLPEHLFPHLVSKFLGYPVTATSANISGEPPIYDSRELFRKLKGLDFIVDAGTLPFVEVSTVIDFTVYPPRILREGAVKREYIEKFLGFRLE